MFTYARIARKESTDGRKWQASYRFCWIEVHIKILSTIYMSHDHKMALMIQFQCKWL